MIVYNATKEVFLEDTFTREIHEVIQERLRERGVNVGRSELSSWKESLVYMARALNDDDIPQDSGVAIEFGIPQTGKRIDFILCGQGEDLRTNVIIVELKQWSSALRTDKDGIVIARYASGQREVSHPSYQAWSYAALLNGFNEAIYDGDLTLRPCAYLHNYVPDDVIKNDCYRHYIEKAPAFLRGEKEQRKLQGFIKQHVKFGDKENAIFLIENGRIRPSKMLADSLVRMMKGNEEFILIDDQKVVYESAIALAKQGSAESKKVMIVRGGPGTGKSVVAINLLVTLTKLGLVCRYVSKNAAPRAVYESKLTGTLRRSEISNLFSGSGVFSETDENAFDVLIVDEAHRLNEKSGLYGNLGENQIKEILASAKCSIFFMDEDQLVTLRDIGRETEIEKWAQQLNAEVSKGELASQFRCGGSDGYLAWLDNLLQVRNTANEIFDVRGFDFRIFDSPVLLQQAIKDKNLICNKARLVAGYCWNWVSKRNPERYDVQIPEHDFRMRWNLSSDGSLWIVAPTSVDEIGCIHTSQGLEVDYVGVIIGPDLVVRNGKVVTRPECRATTDKSLSGLGRMVREDFAAAHAKSDVIIKNTYRTLMTRGLKGCFVYCTDPETAAYFRARLIGERQADPATRGDIAKPAANKVLPFEQVRRRRADPYKTAVPVVSLKIAAGAFGETQLVGLDHDDWAVLPPEYRPQEGLFVAQVVGESMNRRVPNGSWCLFRFNPVGTRQGKAVLAQHRGIDDPETGGSYTLKVYHSRKTSDADGEWRHVQVTLSPDSDDKRFKKIEFGPEATEQLRIIAELISVL